VSKETSSDLTALVNMCLQGNKRAWVELIDRLYPIINSICLSMRLPRDERFDIFGQVQLLLLKNLDSVKSPESLISYVATMTRREIREMIRKSNYFNHMRRSVIEEIYSSDVRTPDVILEKVQEGEILMGAVAKLPPNCHKLLKAMFFDQGQPTYKELSRMLGIPVSSIGPTRERCLKRLQNLLKENK